VIGHQHGIVVHPGATIGDDCQIRHGCTIGAATDDGFWRQVPTLGSRVNVGAGAMIIGRVHVGDDVRIGPNAVVMTNIPAGSIVLAEAPRIIRPRAPEPG
jgi:serine O-acetyltransferase